MKGKVAAISKLSPFIGTTSQLSILVRQDSPQYTDFFAYKKQDWLYFHRPSPIAERRHETSLNRYSNGVNVVARPEAAQYLLAVIFYCVLADEKLFRHLARRKALAEQRSNG